MGRIKVEKLTDAEIKKRGIRNWPIWEKEACTFDWSYDSVEECLFLAGRVTVKSDQGDVEIKAGDFVTFPEGLTCVWEVHEPIRKHYNFR